MNERDGYVKLRLVVAKYKPGLNRQRANQEAHRLWQQLSSEQRVSAMEELLPKLRNRLEKEEKEQ